MTHSEGRAENILASQVAELEETLVEIAGRIPAAGPMRTRSVNALDGGFEAEQSLTDRLTVMRHATQVLLGEPRGAARSETLQASLERLGRGDVYCQFYERIVASSA